MYPGLVFYSRGSSLTTNGLFYYILNCIAQHSDKYKIVSQEVAGFMKINAYFFIQVACCHQVHITHQLNPKKAHLLCNSWKRAKLLTLLHLAFAQDAFLLRPIQRQM